MTTPKPTFSQADWYKALDPEARATSALMAAFTKLDACEREIIYRIITRMSKMPAFQDMTFDDRLEILSKIGVFA